MFLPRYFTNNLIRGFFVWGTKNALFLALVVFISLLYPQEVSAQLGYITDQNRDGVVDVVDRKLFMIKLGDNDFSVDTDQNRELDIFDYNLFVNNYDKLVNGITLNLKLTADQDNSNLITDSVVTVAQTPYVKSLSNFLGNANDNPTHKLEIEVAGRAIDSFKFKLNRSIFVDDPRTNNNSQLPVQPTSYLQIPYIGGMKVVITSLENNLTFSIDEKKISTAVSGIPSAQSPFSKKSLGLTSADDGFYDILFISDSFRKKV